MTNTEQIISARDNLSRVLGLFTRVESKASVILGIDTALLAILVSNSPNWSIFTEWYMFFWTIPVLLLLASIWHIYQSNTPNLSGGDSSLIYFKEISKRTESNFISEFKQQTEEQYLNDLLGQVWRNSEILNQKFNHIKNAFQCLAIAIIPWIIALCIFVFKNNLVDRLIK